MLTRPLGVMTAFESSVTPVFGGTVAHGFLTLSLLSRMAAQ